ncbi:MAG: hypothetical protein R2712_17765 [Vicinamibacterales bacterium]
MTAWAGDSEIARATMGSDGVWSFEVPREALAASGGRITIATSQTFSPAERGGPPDQRRLGLRIFEIRVNPVSLR